MRAKNPQKLYTLILLIGSILLPILIFSAVWNIMKDIDNTIAENYQILADLSPEVIISCQQNKPHTWEDYVAVYSAFEVKEKEKDRITKDSLNTACNSIINQLNSGVTFPKLNWYGVNQDIQEKAGHYRLLLKKYPLYNPGKYKFPLPERCYYIDTFGADREGGARSHQGTDLFDKKGTPIFNVCPGRIERLGWNRLGGERVGVRGEDGNYYYYAHLDTINPELYINMKVTKGEFLGTMGNTGDAITTPDHLHFGIELPNGEWANPYSFLKVWEYHTI